MSVHHYKNESYGYHCERCGDTLPLTSSDQARVRRIKEKEEVNQRARDNQGTQVRPTNKG